MTSFLEKYTHKRVDIREALQIAQDENTRLASITEIANEVPPEIAVNLGPICSGTIMAFMKQKSGPRARIGGDFYSEIENKRINLDFEFAGIDHTQGHCYVMPPGTYSVKQTKGSIVFTASREFVPAYEYFDVGKRRFYIFSTDLSFADHGVRIETCELGHEYAGPILIFMEGAEKRFLPFGKTLSPFEVYNFFIKKRSAENEP